MANVIAREGITVKSPYPIYDFHELKITHQVNQHATLYLEGLLTADTTEELEKYIYKTSKSDEIQVIAGENQDILFTGKPSSVKVRMVQNLGYIHIECNSGTYAMDLHEKSRSFQDVEMQYTDLLKEMMLPYNGDSINTGARDKAIGRPIIQYKEKDWAFLKRLAAGVGTVLTADITTSKAKLWFGIPDSRKEVSAENTYYTPRILQAATLEKAAHYYHEVHLPDILKIGDKVNLSGDKLTVTSVVHSYTHKEGVLHSKYRIEKPPKMKLYENQRVKGVSLEGTIIDVCLNHVKVHLDIDETQEVDEAFWYPCVQEANNVWYTMPHKDERINLYVTAADETAISMTNTRGTTGDMATTGTMAKPTEKHMETKWNRHMALHEDDIQFDVLTINVTMDEESVKVTSNDKINITSNTDINLGRTVFWYTENGELKERIEETKNICLEADELITVKVSSSESAIELDAYNELHALRRTQFRGSNRLPMPIVHRPTGVSGNV